MSRKSLIWIGMSIGSTAGSMAPTLWGAGIFSASSIICSAVGGFAGIYLGYKFSQFF